MDIYNTGVSGVQVGNICIGNGAPLVLIGGPCVIESEAHALSLGGAIAAITERLDVPFIFKASFDKANRTSAQSFRGPGLDSGLTTLAEVKRTLGVPVLTVQFGPVRCLLRSGRDLECGHMACARMRGTGHGMLTAMR